MDKITELLGNTLTTTGGASVATAEALANKKAIGLYFSAHWCGPCRSFTPQLAKNYTEHLKAKGMEIVFVSSDKDQAQFDSYFASMPWLALPYSQRMLKDTLSKKYKVRGIPSFVILDGANGELITVDGREAVTEDPTGKDLPWKPPGFFDALGEEFLSGTEGDTVSLDELKESAKYIGLYFSAHWCPPCRSFTPSLVEAYKKHLKAKGLEIIFVSSDRDQASFAEYYGTMPWLAIPNGDARKNKLSKAFGVSGIPMFVLVDAATGETITTQARGKVSSDPTGAEFPWLPKALNNMSEGEGLESINEEAALCVLLDGCDAAAKDAAKAVLEPIAEAHKAAGDSCVFFYAPDADGPVAQIRKLTKLPAGGKPAIVLLDIPDNGGFYVSPAEDVTAETITTFLDMYKAKALDRQQLG